MGFSYISAFFVERRAIAGCVLWAIFSHSASAPLSMYTVTLQRTPHGQHNHSEARDQDPKPRSLQLLYLYRRHGADPLLSVFYDAGAPTATEASSDLKHMPSGGKGSRNTVVSMAYDRPLDCSYPRCSRLLRPSLRYLVPALAGAAAAAAATSASTPQLLSKPLLSLPAQRNPGRPMSSKNKLQSVTPPHDENREDFCCCCRRPRHKPSLCGEFDGCVITFRGFLPLSPFSCRACALLICGGQADSLRPIAALSGFWVALITIHSHSEPSQHIPT